MGNEASKFLPELEGQRIPTLGGVEDRLIVQSPSVVNVDKVPRSRL